MKAAGNDTRIAYREDGTPWAVFLAGNATAEHEWGIRDLLANLMIDPEGMLTAGRSMTAPQELHISKGEVTRVYFLPRTEGKTRRKKETTKVTYLGMSEYSVSAKVRHHELERYTLETDLTGAWSSKEFKLAAWSDEARAFLKELAKAASNGDLTIWTGNTPALVKNPFSHSGLIIAITSRMPDASRIHLDEHDTAQKKLNDAAEETGIRERLKASGSKLASWRHGPAFHALVPRWLEGLHKVTRNDTEVQLSSDHPVVFFLNPANQQDFNHGYFTVEELDQWLKGKGPIIKSKAA